jgi:cyclopropane-fatty-acyl-phospholipid synthase
MNSKVSYLFTIPQRIASYRFLNTIGNSRSNISAHYDISNQMFSGKALHFRFALLCKQIFQGFLSEDMTYSCAIFKDLDGDIKRDRLNRTPPDNVSLPLAPCLDIEPDELQEAQIRKLNHIIRKAGIFPRQRILEIGSGWGSLAILIASSVVGTSVESITLSVQQQELATERIKAAGLQDRITVHLMDYRNMPPEWKGAFDRVISIEMIEAVGAEFLETYWTTIDWAMKKKGGAGVVQVITLPESRKMSLSFVCSSLLTLTRA